MRVTIKISIMLILLAGLLFYLPLWSGTTGKITGTVIDKTTGDPLPGANVTLVGTSLGAAADMDGNYTILYIPPGIYQMKVTVIGYKEVIVTDVRVRIDQTTRVNANMEMEAVEGEAVTVVAERNLIRDDVATSVVAVSAREIEELPVSNVQNVIKLQAGIEDSLKIRGGRANDALFLVDGVTLRDPRNNVPVFDIALSAIKEISVERGGFNAEYGQVRSGIVNVVTREGEKSGYHGNVEFRYSPPHAKYFGISPFDKNSFWLKPYFDDAVCWTGTDNGEPFTDLNNNGKWDEDEPFEDLNGDGTRSYWDYFTQLQYPDFVGGWNAVSERLMSDNDPTNDLSPRGAQRLFEWQTRKQPAYNQPDYNIDAGLGGPVPFISEKLGNLRFFATYKRYREMLVVPLSRPDYVDYNWTLKVTSDISSSMKLTLSGLIGKQFTMQQNFSYNYLRTPNEIASVVGDFGELFGTGTFSLADIGHKSFSGKLTHIINSKTFYEISLEHFIRTYYTRPDARRDKTTLYEVLPGYYADEAPFGYDYEDEFGVAASFRFGGFNSLRRDNTKATSTTLKADFTSQVNFHNLVKTGLEFVYNDIHFDYGTIAFYYLDRWAEHVVLDAKPIRAAVYLQDKLETKGFIMNLGLRLDYSNSNTDWYDPYIYDENFFTSKYATDLMFPMINPKPQWQLSPRLGISHPVTENSKLYFNYGHFKQMPSYETLFRIGRSADHRLTVFGDPNLILAKTISYELGYDHSLFNDYLFQIAAFYHDIFDQQNTTHYASVGGIQYDRTTSNRYEDVRGFEVSLRKSRGRWWSFFGNYTYQVSTSGHFDRAFIYEDLTRQKEYDEATVNLYQERPIPRPYARFNLSVYTPEDFGPSWAKIHPIGDFSANLLLNWQAGRWVDYNPKVLVGVGNNVQQPDYFDVTLRFGKTVNIGKLRIYAFLDVQNLLNIRRMSLSNFNGKANDRQLYNESLHLPKSEAYDNIPGNDRIGDYRKEGVPYQPVYSKGQINYSSDTGIAGVIYFDKATGRYVEYIDGAWQDVQSKRMYQILKDKAYIDMPDMSSFSFFNPRQFFFGIRLSYDLQ